MLTKSLSPTHRLASHRVGLPTFITFFLWYCLLSFFRHFSLNSGVYDLGLFTQWSYLSSVGEFWSPSSLTEFIKPAIGDHFSLILVPLGLLLRVFPSAYTLLAIQSAGLALLSTLFIRHVFLTTISQRYRVLLLVSLFLNPFLINSALNDFHPEIAFSFLAFASLTFLRDDRLIPSISCLCCFVITKEAMAFFAIGYSLYALLQRKLSLAAVVFCCSIAYFAFASSIVDSYQSYSLSRYGHLGDSYADVLQSVFLRPSQFLAAWLNRNSVIYLLGLFFPFSSLICFPASLPALIASFPILFANMLSESPVMRDPIYQYQLPAVVFILVSVLDAIDSFSFQSERTNMLARLYIFLVSGVVSFLLLSQWSLFPTHYLRNLGLSFKVLKLEAQLSSPTLSIWAHERIAAHFSARPNIFYLEKDLYTRSPDLIIVPTYRPASPPTSIITKVRNLVFNYGDEDVFSNSDAIHSVARLRGYDCVNNSVIVCAKK